MNKILLLLLVLSFQCTLNAQHSLGLKLDGGISKITNKIELSGGQIQTQFHFSWHGGLQYNYQLTNMSSFGAELLYSRINGKEHTSGDLIDGSFTVVGTFSDDFIMHISYLGIPVYYEIKLGKVSLNLGIQFSFVIKSKAKDEMHSVLYGEPQNSTREYNDLNIDKLDFGARAGLIYWVNDKISIESIYYHGLNNILGSAGSNDWKQRNRQLTVGIRYKLF